jgi:hypothetical protein
MISMNGLLKCPSVYKYVFLYKKTIRQLESTNSPICAHTIHTTCMGNAPMLFPCLYLWNLMWPLSSHTFHFKQGRISAILTINSILCPSLSYLQQISYSHYPTHVQSTNLLMGAATDIWQEQSTTSYSIREEVAGRELDTRLGQWDTEFEDG